eukprot:7101799-Prymnesium_polylepis.1
MARMLVEIKTWVTTFLTDNCSEMTQELRGDYNSKFHTQQVQLDALWKAVYGVTSTPPKAKPAQKRTPKNTTSPPKTRKGVQKKTGRVQSMQQKI